MADLGIEMPIGDQDFTAPTKGLPEPAPQPGETGLPPQAEAPADSATTGTTGEGTAVGPPAEGPVPQEELAQTAAVQEPPPEPQGNGDRADEEKLARTVAAARRQEEGGEGQREEQLTTHEAIKAALDSQFTATPQIIAEAYETDAEKVATQLKKTVDDLEVTAEVERRQKALEDSQTQQVVEIATHVNQIVAAAEKAVKDARLKPNSAEAEEIEKGFYDKKGNIGGRDIKPHISQLLKTLVQISQDEQLPEGLRQRAQQAHQVLRPRMIVDRSNPDNVYFANEAVLETRQEIALTAAGAIENVVISMGGDRDFHFGQLSRWANRLKEAIVRGEGNIDSLVSLVTHAASEYMETHGEQIQRTDELAQALSHLDLNLNYYREGNNDPLRQLLRNQLIAARLPAVRINEILNNPNIHIGTLVTFATSVDSERIKLMGDRQNFDRLSSKFRQFVNLGILTGEEGGFLVDMLRGGILADVCTFLSRQVGVDPDKNKSIKDLLHGSVDQVLRRAKLELNQKNRQAFFKLTNYEDEDILALERESNLSGLLMKGMVAGMLLSMIQNVLDTGVETAEPARPR